MTIKIGGQTLAISRDGLDEKLIDLTGCSVPEHAAMLASGGTPGQVARVLGVMLKDAMPIGKLADAIAEAGVDQVRMDLVALLTLTHEPTAKKGATDGNA